MFAWLYGWQSMKKDCFIYVQGAFAKSRQNLLLHAFASDILEQVKPEAIRSYVEKIIHERLEENYDSNRSQI